MEEQSKLSRMGVAAPCTSSWDKMTGDETVRFCHECKLNVYNISSMTERDAEELIRQKEGKLCVRFYRRKDGTVLTDNCPVGLRRIRNFGRKVAAVVALGISWLMSGDVLASDKQCPEAAKSQTSGPPTMGVYLQDPMDAYKAELLEQIGKGWHEKGGPVLNLQISKSGTVESVSVLTSCGTAAIDDAAVKTLKETKCAPLPTSYVGDTLTIPIDLSGANRK